MQRISSNVDRLERPQDGCQARAQRRQTVVVQPEFGKTRRPVVGLARFGRRFGGWRTVQPAAGGGRSRLEATEGVAVDRKRGDVVAEVQLSQAETVEGERMQKTQSIMTQVKLTKSPEMSQRFGRYCRQQIALRRHNRLRLISVHLRFTTGHLIKPVGVRVCVCVVSEM